MSAGTLFTAWSQKPANRDKRLVVKDGVWYCDAVEYAVKNNLFYDTSGTIFSPGQNMTQRMMVTVLYHMGRISLSHVL